MKIIYRLTERPSTNPSPIFNEDKLKLNKLCLRSVIAAFKGLNPKMIFICDYCSSQTTEMIKQIVPFEYKIKETTLGVYGTAEYQYDLVEPADDFILFQECDYFYLPGSGKELFEACKELGYVSPYDHPDKYPVERSSIQILDRHWKSTVSTTSTFMTPMKLFIDDFAIFQKYGWIDHSRWVEIGKKGHELWTPIPSLATHMVKDYMAPIVNWKEAFEAYL